MACDTLAALVTETMIGLGMPNKELCEIEDVVKAVKDQLALLNQYTVFSSQNLDLKHYDWSPAGRSVSLADVTDLAVPAWVQRKWSATVLPDQDYWVDVRVCNLAELESARMRGEWSRCAFHVDDGEMYISFSYNPSDYSYRQHRLWYSPNPDLATTLDDVVLNITLLPAFRTLITDGAALEVLSIIRIRAAMNADPNKELLNAWEKREQYLQASVALWTDRFKHFVFAERGNRKGGRRRTILPKGMRI